MRGLEAATPSDYESYLRVHLVPFLASWSLDEIDRTSSYERPARGWWEGRRDVAPPGSSPQPVVADQVSVLPNVPGQAPSGHGAGSASVPAASDAARYV